MTQARAIPSTQDDARHLAASTRAPGPWAPSQAPANGRPVGFELLARCSRTAARRGQLVTRHAVVETPVFMPVGTLGAIKSLGADDTARLGARIILNNAYHLMLRPGAARVAAAGGLHAFAGNPGAILTDSGGYQVFSLAASRRLTEQGVTFRSHVDGRALALTPESLVATQEALYPDIAMVLDECPPGQASREQVAAATARTSRWARRCLAARQRPGLGWFAIVQGGTFEDLRAAHAQEIGELPCDGFAIGGVSVGESREDIARVVALTAPLLPQARPRYLMGVGTPHDLVRGVAAGVDMFDCVMPSRHARNGQLFTSSGRLTIKHAAHADRQDPIDARCSCPTCQRHSLAFLRHLFVSGELSYFRLATLHNVHFYLTLMARIRDAIAADTFNPTAMLAELGPEVGQRGLSPAIGSCK